MASLRSVEERLDLITRRQPEILGQDLIKTLLEEGKTLKCFWATTPTGKPHIGYFIPLVKFADFLEAGVEVTVLLLDTYGLLVNYKYPWEQVLQRREYYRFIVTAVLDAIGIPLSKVHFVDESSYEGSKEFMIDHYKFCTLLSQQDVRDTGAEVAKSDMFSPMLSPGLQSLAEEYLGADIQFGGLDQRGIFNMGEKFLPLLGYRKRAHMMNAMLGSLVGGKMSSSDPPHTKIMFLDDPETVRAKISGALCEEGNVETNGILPTLKEILIPISEIWVELEKAQRKNQPEQVNGIVGDRRSFVSKDAPEDTLFSVPLEPTGSDNFKHFNSYHQIEQDFAQKKLHPDALKAAVAEAINQLLAPIRTAYERNDEWQRVDEKAYPDDVPSC